MDATADKREAILKTALALFTERGFYGTPTAMISKEAGVATGTLFFYFPTKEELIDTLYRQIKAAAAAAIREGVGGEPTVEAKIRRVGENTLSWAIAHPDEFRFMEQFAHSPFVSTTAHEEGMSHFAFLEGSHAGRDPHGGPARVRYLAALLGARLLVLGPCRHGSWLPRIKRSG